MTQLVLIGNRVAAHGVDCFLAMGGTVIRPDTGKAFQNATIAEHDGAIPSDIDSVGYEYIAGEFRPCAPYGKTDTGHLMAACDSCSQPKQTDIELLNGNVRLNSKGVVLGSKAYGTDLPDDGDYTPGRVFAVKGCAPILKMVYPVGSIYLSIANTNPADLFGFGTWERIKDRFILAAGDTYAPGTTGGEATHVLTENELPYIDGSLNIHGQADGTLIYTTSGHFSGTTVEGKYKDGGNTAASASSIKNPKFSFGGGAGHNNMPPYLSVYIWQRIS